MLFDCMAMIGTTDNLIFPWNEKSLMKLNSYSLHARFRFYDQQNEIAHGER